LHHVELGFERNGVIRTSDLVSSGNEPTDKETETCAQGEADQERDNRFVHVHSLPVTSDAHENLH
jgi:hypothetical protein